MSNTTSGSQNVQPNRTPLQDNTVPTAGSVSVSDQLAANKATNQTPAQQAAPNSSRFPKSGGSAGPVSSQMPVKKPFNMLKFAFIFIILAVLVLGGYVGYQQYKSRSAPDPESTALAPTEFVEQDSSSTEDSQNVVDESGDTSPSMVTELSSIESIDFQKCNIGDGYSRSVPSGSTYLSIVDLDDPNGICVAELLNETENGYIKYSCNVPRSIRVVEFNLSDSGSDFSEIMRFCSESDTGSTAQ